MTHPKTVAMRKRRRGRREAIAKYKLQKGCVDCGFNKHPAALQFDHLPQFRKVGNVSQMVGAASKVWEEIAKCEVVCANCHAIRTHRRKIGPTNE